MIHVAIDTILIDALGEQLADNLENLGTGAVKGKATCIGHHSTIHGYGKSLIQLGKSAHLPYNAEHQFASARSLGLRHYQVGRYIGLQVVIDEHLLSRAIDERLLHFIDTTRGIEVETEHKVCYLKQHVALLRVLVVTYYLISIGQPLEKVWILIGHHHCSILATLAQKLGPGQR